MKCNNEKCGKKFSAPLELFNGAITCPHCKKEQTVIRTFSVTVENHEMYKLSELYYFRYLSPQSYDADKVKISFDRSEMLDMAIKLCREATKLGNPKATYKMAFYNEHYLDAVRSESERIKMAFDYYSALCYNEDVKLNVEKGIRGYSDEDFKELKRQAAISLLELYANYSNILEGSSKYDYENNKQRITKLYGDITLEFKTVNDKSRGKVKSVVNVISACFGKKRAPLFGLFKLTGAELKALFETKGSSSRKMTLSKYISKGFELRYLMCDAMGKPLDSETYFSRFASDEKAAEILADMQDDANLYLFFFNMSGKHNYLSGGQMKAVHKELAASDYALLYSLIDFDAKDYLFFDDDIMQFKKRGSVKGAVKKLINYITGEN